ncbi:hypothetical protein MPDQ_007536 [Monascus purpureus]|uniref:RBR-type E3 ubiquitin transferase n=1 Tax=Monascus purpureus TaxID=5098 RepID=A0A507QTQ4_MONPU|nr:hypothetical protein MPDQ_007536 [Monascus purpureus]BDD54445.1 hypothetical protein MAP00_000063 [Monascus purpureus]
MEYDLLLIIDATSSMYSYLEALRIALPQVVSISAITGCFSRCGLLAYRDYDQGESTLLEWSGWQENGHNEEGDESQPDILALARSLKQFGGADSPEATKTALAKAYEVMRPETKTIILLYTDAPPHTTVNENIDCHIGYRRSNTQMERDALENPDAYGGYGPKFVDWVSACNELRYGPKKAHVFSIVEKFITPGVVGYYTFLSTTTGGACIVLDCTEPSDIARMTVDILLAWMGVAKTGSFNLDPPPARLARYKTTDDIKDLTDENDKRGFKFFPVPGSGKDVQTAFLTNVFFTLMITDTVQKYLPKKDIPLADFAMAYSTDATYRQLVVKHLKRIIDNDVRAIALNPVFGSLWRIFCKDRQNNSRHEVINAFSVQVDRIADAGDRTAMKGWLEASYDYTQEVLDIIARVPEDNRFPCVCLDPTLSFSHADARQLDDNEDDDTNKPISQFTRKELLEIGRSCDSKILRRLSRVLTRLTYIESEADMPEHLAMTGNEEIPKIPTILATDQFDHKFWEVLLHLVVPGTFLSARPAALLAALGLKLGIAPLFHAAERKMLSFRDKWNNIKTPENWNVSCLSLLLDADSAYRSRLEESGSLSQDGQAPANLSTLIKPSDRKLFEHLIAYRVLELNMDSQLTARIGWKPAKTSVPVGFLVTCRSCQYPRSVTIMGPNKQCGICLSTEPEVREKVKHIRVSRDDTEATHAAWVECGVATCRAQYVVYNPEALKTNSKCHYCRNDNDRNHPNRAPWVECQRCLNRIIWPEEYRPFAFDQSSFVCVHCVSGVETIQDMEITAKELCTENGPKWLIYDSRKPDTIPFINHSLFGTISAIGTDSFVSQMHIFPTADASLKLQGKPILNTLSLISNLKDRVSRRETARTHCSLCFSTFHPTALNPACGRRGCKQRICKDCLSSWYGLNEPGTIINTAALSCPFCRRLPSGRTLAKYGMGVYAVGNLVDAVRDKGTWIYAWCETCSFARQFMERVCARGTPTDVSNWTCEICRAEQERLDNRRVQGIKPCPGCGTMTEKISGCGHIQCTVEGCKKHWCYFCGNAFDSDSIYVHMNRVHNGIYDEDAKYESD